MLVVRLLVMVLSIICLMDGHAEVSSSITGIRNSEESPAVEANEPKAHILDRKKKKPKKSKKTKGKKAKGKKPKPVITTPTMRTSTLKTSTSTATTLTTAKKTTLKTTPPMTSSTKTTTIMSSATMSTTVLTSPPPTTAKTTADSGSKGECIATNGKPCVFPFKDGNKEYNECKNHGGKYFWCATAVYDSGKFKHWSYCSKDGPCPLEGNGECRATNNMPCVFPFNDGKQEYNECADFGGTYFWCATGTNAAGKYTSWSKCPKDGSCPLLEKNTTPVTTSTESTVYTSLPTNDTSAAAGAIANVENTLNDIDETLQNLETAGFSEDEKQLLETISDLSDYLKYGSLMRNAYDPFKIKYLSQQLVSTTENMKSTKQISKGFYKTYQSKGSTCSISAENAKLSQVNTGPGKMFLLHTISNKLGSVTNVPSSSTCCAECKTIAADSQLFEFSKSYKQCDCYKTKPGVVPETISSYTRDSGTCPDKGLCPAPTFNAKYQDVSADDKKNNKIYQPHPDGIITDPTKWPWTVSLLNLQRNAMCGASLISCRHILTAKHCVLKGILVATYPEKKYKIIDEPIQPRELEISLGNPRYLEGFEKREGEELYYPKGWLGTENLALETDIAVVLMNKKVNFDATIQPIKLPDSDITMWEEGLYPDRRDTDFYVTGWGDGKFKFFNNGFNILLQETNQLKIRDYKKCGMIPTNICIQRFGEDTNNPALFCNGDSGSPGVIQVAPNDWRVFAVMSYVRTDCPFGGLGGAVNVFSQRDSINEVLANKHPEGWARVDAVGISYGTGSQEF